MAGEQEILITPKMIEAGHMAYLSHEEAFEPIEEIVSHIYRAMEAAKEK